MGITMKPNTDRAVNGYGNTMAGGLIWDSEGVVVAGFHFPTAYL